ncbi:uncharacterized protein PG998_001007 [Apiospora kogelbergensis]|uniref:uncharacterized protein n=1 Tax=Apiospora kogelbergensis TaxID=1337665 RepID=UPI00313289B7
MLPARFPPNATKHGSEMCRRQCQCQWRLVRVRSSTKRRMPLGSSRVTVLACTENQIMILDEAFGNR